MRPILYSIKSKIVIFAVIATLLPTIGLGLLSFKQNETLISDSVTRELRALADSINRQLNQWIEENTLAVRALSTSNPVIEGLITLKQFSNNKSVNAAEQAQSVMVSYLHSVQAKLDEVLELTVFDDTRKIVASSADIPEVRESPEQWTHTSLTSGVIAMPPAWNARYATATISIIYPVLSYDSQLIGAIAATLDLGTLKNKLAEIKKFSTGEVIILSQSGQILLSSAPGVDHQITLSPHQWELTQMFEESVSYDGLSYPKAIGLAYASENIPVTILVEQDHSVIQAAWIKLRNRFLEFVSMLIVIVTSVALYMGHSIVTPLKQLINAARGIVEGNLDIHLSAKRKDEVGQLTDMFNQMTHALRNKHAEITAANQAMQQQNQLLQKLSITDGLTGLYNRTKLNTILSEQLARFKRHNRSFCLLMIDVDYFKTINDKLGHIVGDRILVTVASVLLKSIRTIDYAARYGGDEFMVILTETDSSAAIKTAERIRAEVSAACLAFKEQPVHITLSIGITQSRRADTMPNNLIARADAALYEAKESGRDRVYCADS
ncbi:diguanylate cyclase [Nitrosomonas sp.]|uniref:sensor domain-containing diguanylate cyclase n=1 Tax=Nitrosomonas sp. TaxID=42353 RepID=UPI0025E15D06|nr:diguanylate cyclase [Nitrosomonas sp.]